MHLAMQLREWEESSARLTLPAWSLFPWKEAK